MYVSLNMTLDSLLISVLQLGNQHESLHNRVLHIYYITQCDY